MTSDVDRQFRLARIWSNHELAKVGHLFEGDVVNVSAGEDNDKEGKSYASYFPNKGQYYLTNYSPDSFRGYQGRANEFLVDLTKDVPADLAGKFDVAYNHTTLEHIFDVATAFRNICILSRDIVILVVPFAQVQHEREGAYGDFWRFTPTCMRRLFRENGFQVVYESANNHENAAVYLFFVASRFPHKWRDKMPEFTHVYPAGDWIGKSAPNNQKPKLRLMPRRLLGKFSHRLSAVLHLPGN